MQPLRIAIASIFDPRSPSSWSGCSSYLLRSLEEDHGAQLTVLGPLETPRSFGQRLAASYYGRRGHTYLPELREKALRSYAQQTAERLKGVECDCVLALDAHTIARLETALPVYYYWDCTFEGNLEYPWFAALAPSCIAVGHRMERDAIAHARKSFFPSRWAVGSAVGTYGGDPARVATVPLAANIDCDRTEADIERLIAARSTTELHLLFLGVDWLRKGGDLALEVARTMNARGVPTTLHVAGCAPPPGEEVPDFVHLHGFLDKRVPEQLSRLQGLIERAHFLIVPSLAESFGAVFAEASSFGVPSLARRVGGIDSAVEEGVNGWLFDRHAGPEPYADRLMASWRDQDGYRALARSSFRHFGERLTWTYAAGRLVNFIRADLNR